MMEKNVEETTGIVLRLYSFAKGILKEYMKMQYFSDIFVSLRMQQYLNHFCKGF
jgi:hypothetical protein